MPARAPWIDPYGRFKTEGILPGTYRIEVEATLVEESERGRVGPTGGFIAHRPVGPARVFPLGEVEVRPRETASFEAAVPEEALRREEE